MTKRKRDASHIKIPEPLIYEVDRIVTETGLYSDESDFVTDAVRRLIIESNRTEVNVISNVTNRRTKGRVDIRNVKEKRMLNKSIQM